MFCKKCGEKMPDGATICLKCGASTSAASKMSRKPSGVQECSEKNQLMVRVKGKGLYFISGGKRLCLMNQTTNAVRSLTDESPDVNLCGLGYYDGALYYWLECRDELSGQGGIRLLRMDPESEAREVVWECEDELFEDYRLDDTQNRARAILYDGDYYLLNYAEQKLMRVKLPSGDWENLPLPDMRNRVPQYDWVEPRGVVNINKAEPNFGQRFTGLNLINDRVFLSLDNSALCTLMYPLNHPEAIVYLPKNAAVSIQNDLLGGMLTTVGGRIFSCPGTAIGSSDLGFYELNSDGNTVRMLSSETDDIILQNKGGYWWKLGGTLYVGTIAIDPIIRKWHKISPLLFDAGEFCHNVMGEVLDFFPAPNNGVYLLTKTSLYQIPPDWEIRVKALSDLKKFRLVRLKDIR